MLIRVSIKSDFALLVFAIIFFAALVYCDEDEKISARQHDARDSYLEAYTESHQGNEGLNQQSLAIKSDREFTEPYPYPAPAHGSGSFQYGPPLLPTGPTAQYGPPSGPYGAPAPYPQQHQYPPTAPVYGPPPPPQPFYQTGHGMLGVLDKIKMKIDLFTIGKILIKLVIFKKIVTLIGFVCLLLFIPWLKNKGSISTGGDDDGQDRSTAAHGVDSLDLVTGFVLDAIDYYSAKNGGGASESTNCNDNDGVCHQRET